ncbi:shieldin complex subunit 2 isoform X1 [Anguilla rostrata]|uniref:shieldin complex subunit 2 isoform X1 n=1 Tax=Anguilla rostrata TaxID=7938 RepID=UPI0030D5D802
MDKPKIHIFLGAPTLPLKMAPSGEPGCARWETVDLCLKGVRLQPKGKEHGAQGSDISAVGGASDEQGGADKAVLANEGPDRPNIDPGGVPDKDAPVSGNAEGDRERISQPDLDPEERGSSQKKRSAVDEQDPCPEAVREYLDSCFRAPGPGTGAEPAGGEAPPRLSLEAEFLSSWTTSQALLLKGRRGLPAGSSPQGAGAPPTPPTPQNRAPVGSGSSPELYSPTSSPRGAQESSQELFHTLSERQAEGGVVLEATPEGVLCSQGSPSASPSRKPAEEAESLWASPRPGPSSRTSPRPGPSLRTSPRPGPLDLWTSPRPGPSLRTSPRPGPSLWTSPRPGPSLRTSPRPGPSLRTSPTPPSAKKSRVSPTGAKTRGGQTEGACVPPQSGPTTLLGRCVARGVRYSLLVAVVYPCHLKEIKVKSGTWAGSTVPLATIVVTDQSGVDMKVVLWRTAAFWALTVYPGDLLLITGVTLNEDKWRGEVVLQSSYASRLLNLGQLTSALPPPVPQNVNIRAVKELWGHLCKKRPLLVSLPRRTVQDPHAIPYVRLRVLKPDTLVHVLVRVTHSTMVTAWRDEAESCSRAGGVQKAVLSVEQEDGHQGTLVLWGSAMAWLQRIRRNQGAVWEFRVLLVKRNVATGRLELHSTPWGSCEPLFPDDRRAVEFHDRAQSKPPPASLELDLATLLSQKYSGDVEFKGQIVAFQFQGTSSQNASPPMNGDTPSRKILEAVSGDVTFNGCGRCGAELEADDNGIYRPCYPCLPRTSVRRYYRPAVLTVRDGSSEVCVQVPSSLVQKILLNTSPDKLSKTVAPSSDVRFAQVVAARLRALLSVPRDTFLLTVSSHFLCDENSVPTAQDFLLLDIRP